MWVQFLLGVPKLLNAGVSESADEADSKSVAFIGVWVQVPSPAPIKRT